VTEIRADLIVVGMGIAGLSAALAASEAGAKVVVVDRASLGQSGGNTRYTEAFMRMKSVDEPSDDLATPFSEISWAIQIPAS